MERLPERDGERAALNSIVRLALPAILQNIMGSIMQYVDTAMVGHLGEQATASVSTTTSVGWLVGSLPYAFSIGSLTLIARAYGAGERERAKRCAAIASFIGLLIGIFLTALTLGLSPFIPRWMMADEVIRESASRYFFIINTVMILRTVGTVMTTALQAVRDTRTPMVIGLISNVLNIVLNWILIYGVGLGVDGAAIATAAASAFSGILTIIMFFKNDWISFSPLKLKEYFDMDILEKMTSIAVPALGNATTHCLGHVVFASLVNSMGTTIFAAHSIAISAEEIFYIPGYGIKTATSTLIGNALGEGNEKRLKNVKRMSIRLTLTVMTISGIILYLTSGMLMRVFTNSEPVILYGASILKLVAFSEPFFGLKIAQEGICFGLGRTKRVFFIETFCMWGIRIVFTCIVINVLHLGIREVWLCMIADNVAEALLLSFFNRK